MNNLQSPPIEAKTLLEKIILFFLENKLITIMMMLVFLIWGIAVAPFDWKISWMERSPVPVDAIPDIGENQQIVFTKWMGRSPQDIEDQISYPLTTSLMGIPGVKTIRSYSMFGFSTIYIIFNEDVEFYWSRSRVLEKLNSLPPGTVPEGIRPSLGPDATALGQVFWYTLEGQDENGNPTGGWDLEELRRIQDYYVRYALQSAEGVSEVASIGGFVKEYQIDIDPDALRYYNISLEQVFKAVRESNIDVGARTIEINKAEYVIRGIGFIKSLGDIEKVVLKEVNNVPITVDKVAKVVAGPGLRRGVLDKGGAEAVGGVVVVRYGENPLKTLQNVKNKISEISPGLPEKTLGNGQVSKVAVVPFYDRSGLIYETLETLNTALTDEILVTIIVVIIMLMNLRSSLLISGLLPMAVLMSFIGMKIFKVDANIVALSGIAIAIGTIVDMGIVLVENILKHFDAAKKDDDSKTIIFKASSEVAGAVLTAISTTVIGFLPVFTMTAAEGKLFKPLAFTKTFALISSLIVALTMVPAMAHLFMGNKPNRKSKLYSLILTVAIPLALFVAGIYVWNIIGWWAAIFIFAMAIIKVIPERYFNYKEQSINYLSVAMVAMILADHWNPLGPERNLFINFLFISFIIGGLLGFFQLFIRYYPKILGWALENKAKFLSIPFAIFIFGMSAWLGFNSIFGFLPDFVKSSKPFVALNHKIPGLSKEFMPPLDEGSFLYMPTTMPHASIGEAQDVLQILDIAIASIPEVDEAVGKLGRVESPLDPAPISMIETVISYKSEYKLNEFGKKIKYRYDKKQKDYVRNERGELIEDEKGRPFRQWRPEIKNTQDIWDEIVKIASIPGTTSAPKLQPIGARLVMLQSGMRAPMGIKIKGPNLETIEKVGLSLEKFLKDIPSVKASAVFADRIVGKPYLEIHIDRDAIARYGITIQKIQQHIDVALGGKTVTTTVEGRERYNVRVRYLRELRDSMESLGDILITAKKGTHIPLKQLADIVYVRGPQVIKSEDTFLVGYVLFDKEPGFGEVDVVNAADDYLKLKIASGELIIPAGVSYSFAGNYENQVRSEKRLKTVLPIALFIIMIILYFQFKDILTTFIVFSGILVAWSGGFILIWFYNQPWFMDFAIWGTNFRELFQIVPINLSVAVWVGFLALFGIASDDGVIIATYMTQLYDEKKPNSIEAIRQTSLQAGMKRVRPALMTVATTILALLPVLTSTGRGSDVMIPMAIPTFGGMLIVIITLFVVPTLYTLVAEIRYSIKQKLG